MCLPDFLEFKQISQDNAIIGYRIWRNLIKDDNLILKSENQDYKWKSLEGPIIVTEKNSGIYSYNYNYNYNYNNNYNLQGIIKQWGNVAIHNTGFRSEFASIDSLFLIRTSDAKGPKEYLDWIKIFNKKIDKIAEKYNAKTIIWQDFIEQNK